VKRILALITVASALILTGCSQVGSAAEVGSTKISQATVQKSIDAALAERGKVDTTGMQLETGAAFNRSQLRFHLVSVLLAEVIADAKITVTKAEIDSRRAQILTQVGGEANLPKALVGASIAPADFDQYINLILQSEKLASVAVAAGVAQADTGAEIQKLIIAKAIAVKVKVNPRYGTWDATTGDVVAADAASPAATPAATK
jgi:hypothetical protein